MPSKRSTSYTEISTWCQCRMKHYWAYELRITRKIAASAPTIGSCGHVGLAELLKGGDWKKAIKEWKVKQQEPYAKIIRPHKVLTEGEFDPVYDMAVEQYRSYEEIVPMVIKVLERYADYYKDNWEVIATEQKFSIPICSTKVTLSGYWDALLMDHAGKIWVMEAKFPKSQFRTEDMLLLDGQIGIYEYAAIKSGFKVVGTIYQQLLAQVPKTPTLNKNGTMSRAAVATDWPTYKAALIDAGLDPADYTEIEVKLRDKKWFTRSIITRTPLEIQNFRKELERRVWDMRKVKNHIYMCDDRLRCGMCQYRELCVESLKGGDVAYIIANDFAPRSPREEEEEEEVLVING